jgi:hypothetical protein
MQVLLSVHANGAQGQVQGVVKSMVGVALALVSNQGVFPLSPWGMLSAVSWLILILLTLWQWRPDLNQGTRRPDGVMAYAAAALAFVASGLAAKFRNLVLMIPFQVFALKDIRERVRHRPIGRMALFGLALANAAGLWQVARHQGTTKNSWNMPIAEAADVIETSARACPPGSIQVFTIDPVLRKHLTDHHPDWVVLHGFQRFDAPAWSASASCLVWVDTYLGSLSPERQEDLKQAYLQIDGVRSTTTALGANDFVSIKRRIDPSFPTHQVRIHRIDHPRSAERLAAWVRSTEAPDAPIPSSGRHIAAEPRTAD